MSRRAVALTVAVLSLVADCPHVIGKLSILVLPVTNWFHRVQCHPWLHGVQAFKRSCWK